MYEEVELISRLPLLLPYSSATYSLPAHNSRFPADGGEGTDLRLHLAACAHVTKEMAANYGGRMENMEREEEVMGFVI